jgi:hypothetical protein
MSSHGKLPHGVEHGLQHMLSHGMHHMEEVRKQHEEAKPTLSAFRAILDIGLSEEQSVITKLEGYDALDIRVHLQKLPVKLAPKRAYIWLNKHDPIAANMLRLVLSYKGEVKAVQHFQNSTLTEQAVALFQEALENERDILYFVSRKLERRAEALNVTGNTALAGGAYAFTVNPVLAIAALATGAAFRVAGAIAQNAYENSETTEVDIALKEVSAIRAMCKDGDATAIERWCDYKRPALGMSLED